MTRLASEVAAHVPEAAANGAHGTRRGHAPAMFTYGGSVTDALAAGSEVCAGRTKSSGGAVRVPVPKVRRCSPKDRAARTSMRRARLPRAASAHIRCAGRPRPRAKPPPRPHWARGLAAHPTPTYGERGSHSAASAQILRAGRPRFRAERGSAARALAPKVPEEVEQPAPACGERGSHEPPAPTHGALADRDPAPYRPRPHWARGLAAYRWRSNPQGATVRARRYSGIAERARHAAHGRTRTRAPPLFPLRLLPPVLHQCRSSVRRPGP